MVADGSSILLGPQAAGDEPYLLAASVPGLVVVVGAGKRLSQVGSAAFWIGVVGGWITAPPWMTGTVSRYWKAFGPPVLETLVAEVYGPDTNRQIEIARQIRDTFLERARLRLGAIHP
mgnify:CR=1 FL=1